jgi:hypothetical protein
MLANRTTALALDDPSRTLSGLYVSLESVLAVESGLANMSQRASADILLDVLYGALYYWLFWGSLSSSPRPTSTHSPSWCFTTHPRQERPSSVRRAGDELIWFSPQRRACPRFGDATFTPGDVHWLLSLISVLMFFLWLLILASLGMARTSSGYRLILTSLAGICGPASADRKLSATR